MATGTLLGWSLRARFSAAALRTGSEEPMDAEESQKQKEIQAIGELILALGGRESSSPGKVWSSPSDVPAARGPVIGRATAQEGEGGSCTSSGPDWPRWRWSSRPSRGSGGSKLEGP